MKILNLYAGIGGNRKLWGDSHEITAVENDENTANIYSDIFPDDKTIIGDAHQFLLDHYQEFDFIWSSPPCPTHSITNFYLNKQGVVRYPDMRLYQEIIFLKHFFKGKYCIENVQGYYKPLIQPQISGRHYFWCNFNIPVLPNKKTIGAIAGSKGNEEYKKFKKILGFDLSKYSHSSKDLLLRNCVDPEIGKAILNKVIEIDKFNNIQQGVLFSNY